MKKIFLGVLMLACSLSGHDEDVEPPIARLMLIHGGTGPFAMAGYRMGDAALRRLALKRGSVDLEVVHYSPAEIPWTCVADGLLAATGASPGKKNLKLETAGTTYSIVRDKRTGRQVIMQLTPAFEKQYRNLPPNRLNAEGLKVMRAPEASLFTLRVQ